MNKACIIDLHDYPRDKYTHYWEIQIHFGGITKGKEVWNWQVTLYPFNAADGKPVVHKGGPSSSEDSARFDSQSWVLENIENYVRKPT